MSEFSDIVKQFSITPVVQDTTTNTKPLSTTPVRAVGLINQQVIVPPIDFSTIFIPQSASIWYQYNYTAPFDFRVINFGQLRAQVPNNIIKAIICIRYRIGTTVYRYLLTGSSLNTAIVPSLLYSGQLIKRNFVIEVWRLFGGPPCGIFNALTLTTSIIRNPISEDDSLPDQVYALQSVNHDTLVAPINPEALPTIYDAAGSWLTN